MKVCLGHHCMPRASPMIERLHIESRETVELHSCLLMKGQGGALFAAPGAMEAPALLGLFFTQLHVRGVLGWAH